jgi:glutamyl-tRNA synthetase
MKDNIVTRFAPSPTGTLHIGGVRTALYSYLFAKQSEGKFILRIEDTDKERSKKEFEDDITEALKWVGIEWDEFYRQSERTGIYKNYLKKLVDSGAAYISQETPKEPGERSSVIRFKNPNIKIKFGDIILGEIEFDTTELGDFVIAKDMDTPLYHLAVVVDDHEMGITHVIRGQEHVSNTPRQILIQSAIGARQPVYGHIPLILAPDKTKLSKRHGAIPATEYKSQGYLPEALVNFIAFLGWHPRDEREFVTLAELKSIFDIERVQKGGAVFDIEKLRWLNSHYIKEMPPEKLISKLDEFMPEAIKLLPQYTESRLAKASRIIVERIKVFGELSSMADQGELGYLFSAPIYSKELLKDTAYLSDITNLIEKIPADKFTGQNVKDAVWNFATEKGRANVLWPMRAALTGREKSADPFTVAEIIGKEETLSRLRYAETL